MAFHAPGAAGLLAGMAASVLGIVVLVLPAFLVFYAAVVLIGAGLTRLRTGTLRLHVRLPWKPMVAVGLVLATGGAAVLASAGPAVGYQLMADRWAGCTIPYVVNLDRAPRNALSAIHEAARRTAAATGMRLVDDGVTATTVVDYVTMLKPGARITQRPVLVTFLPVPTFQLFERGKDAAAFALSIPERGSTKTVTGVIAVEARTSFARVGPLTLPAILEHEWGHIVGLGHNASPFEVMGTPMHLVSGFAHGDRAGLAHLGHEAGCIP